MPVRWKRRTKQVVLVAYIIKITICCLVYHTAKVEAANVLASLLVCTVAVNAGAEVAKMKPSTRQQTKTICRYRADVENVDFPRRGWYFL